MNLPETFLPTNDIRKLINYKQFCPDYDPEIERNMHKSNVTKAKLIKLKVFSSMFLLFVYRKKNILKKEWDDTFRMWSSKLNRKRFRFIDF